MGARPPSAPSRPHPVGAFWGLLGGFGGRWGQLGDGPRSQSEVYLVWEWSLPKWRERERLHLFQLVWLIG